MVSSREAPEDAEERLLPVSEPPAHAGKPLLQHVWDEFV
jgi:hypothetical protein